MRLKPYCTIRSGNVLIYYTAKIVLDVTSPVPRHSHRPVFAVLNHTIEQQLYKQLDTRIVRTRLAIQGDNLAAVLEDRLKPHKTRYLILPSTFAICKRSKTGR